MKQQIINRFIMVTAIALVAAVFAAPNTFYSDTFGPENTITKSLEKFEIALGLDLKGGTELDYRIDLAEIKAQNDDDDPLNDVNINQIVESVRDALETRVNPAGVGEVIVKRSSIFVNNEKEEHVLIQMPPNTDVEKAKRDAEQDNRLEFFEENPDLEKKAKLKVAAILKDLASSDFQSTGEKLEKVDDLVTYESFGPMFADEISDTKLAALIVKTESGEIVPQVIETTIQPEYKISADGQIEFDGLPYARSVFSLAKVTKIEPVEREKNVEAKRKARHILFGYTGASSAGVDVKYKTKEEAKAKAEETLAGFKENGTDNFGDLAKELSTEGAAQRSFGELGEFGKGQMVPPFEAAVFGVDTPQLIGTVIETDFGFHVIEVTGVTAEEKKVVTEPKYSYDMIVWDKSDMNWVKTKLGGSQLDLATVGYDQVGLPLVNLRFDTEGGDMFGELTKNVAARSCGEDSAGNKQPCRLGIKVGGDWITQPTVREQIVGRDAQITGSFDFDSAHDLADRLNLGAIDAPVKLSGQTTIQAELGEEQLKKSLKAGALGLLATIIFMIFIYRLSGVVAGIALIIYTAIFIMLLKVWPTSFGGPIVLSLAGAAGIALSIGLAVDGNILIFERMKEEIKKGRTLSQSVDLGFERAWTAIRDSNTTTLLICVILFFVGSSVIKGFAITLIVGTLLSMFTAVIVSRNLLRFVLLFKPLEKSIFFGVPESEIGKKTAGAKIRKRKSNK